MQPYKQIHTLDWFRMEEGFSNCSKLVALWSLFVLNLKIFSFRTYYVELLGRGQFIRRRQLPFNQVWNCVNELLALRCEVRKHFPQRKAKQKRWSEAALSGCVCNTPPGVLFWYSRGVGKRPWGVQFLSFQSGEVQPASVGASCSKKMEKRRREVYSASQKKKAWVWCMHYLFWARSTGSWKSTTQRAHYFIIDMVFIQSSALGKKKNLQSIGVALSV